MHVLDRTPSAAVIAAEAIEMLNLARIDLRTLGRLQPRVRFIFRGTEPITNTYAEPVADAECARLAREYLAAGGCMFVLSLTPHEPPKIGLQIETRTSCALLYCDAHDGDLDPFAQRHVTTPFLTAGN